MIEPDLAIHEIGAKDHFSDALARAAATGFAQAISVFPNIQHQLCIAGFDEDERPIWDIPEARAYVRRFAGWVALLMPGRPLEAWALDPGSMAMVLVCTGLGRITGRDPETGGWIVEAGRRPR